MPIPQSRTDLIELIRRSSERLFSDLDRVDASTSSLRCTDDWTIRELIAVRVWWTESVLQWIDRGQRGESQELPAPGYSWSETPRLNNDVVEASRGESLEVLRERLAEAVTRVLLRVDSLNDTDLLALHQFEWAGDWPVLRWISVNTATQYASARTLIRRALRDRDIG